MLKKTMLEIAYDLIKKKKSMDFNVLWSHIIKEVNLNDKDKKNKLPDFYNQLSLDGRFVTFGDNKWYLLDYLPQNKINNFDLNTCYNNDNNDSNYEEELKEENDHGENEDENIET